jgi:hypothetical protein
MNPFETYAAKRAQALSEADDRLRPHITAALNQHGEPGWYDPILNEAEALFAQIYTDEGGDKAQFDAALTAFTEAMSDFLELTTAPSTPVDDAQVERITTWAATFTGNAAVIAALEPDDKMVWTSMRDNAVRESHRLTDGQVRTVGDTFDVGGAALRFPGDPAGPLDEVLGCRCLLLREGGTMAREFAATTDTIDDVEAERDSTLIEDMPDGDEPEFSFENPRWHGVIAPEGSPSGDGRSFAAESITSRDLPLPLRWVRADFGEHGGAVVVGNITALWRDEGLIKAEGDFRTDSPEANEVVGMIATDMLRGVSVDLDDIAFEVDDEMNDLGEQSVTLTKGRVSAATLVDIPAFAEVFIALGGWEEGGVSDKAAMIASCNCSSLDDTGTHLTLGWGSPSEAAGESNDSPAREPADGEYPDWEVGEMVRVGAPSGEVVVATITAIDDATGIATVEVEGGGTLDVLLANLKPYEEPKAPGDNDTGDGFAAATFAPGTKDGRVGTLGRWRVVLPSPSTSSTTDPTTTSAGSGPATSTAPGTGESPSVVARLVVRTESLPTGSSTSAGSAPSPTASSSITSAESVAAATRLISNQSLSAPTTSGARVRTVAVRPAARAYTTSPSPTPGTSGYSMEFSDGRVVPATSWDAESGTVTLSDGIVLVAERALGEFAPGTRDGPGWLTNPEDTQRLRNYWTKGAGAAKINWGVPGDFDRCRTHLAEYVNPLFLAGTCANLHKEAIGTWPGRERGGVASAKTAAFTLVAAANRRFAHTLFERPVLDDPRVGVWIEDDHVFGYIAQWGVCHIGVQGVCTEAPASNTDYWYYATGVVDTDQGQVKVGQITMETGHADLKHPLRIAAAHYDNTGSAVADIAVGEDEFGIWFSGAMRSEVTEAQRHALRAAGRLSGDWRDVRGNLEMVAALAVNVPGFPIPHVALAASGGVQISLVAAGLGGVQEISDERDITALVREALVTIDAERVRAGAVASARATLRAARIERARAALRH